MLLQALCIISQTLVNSNSSYSHPRFLLVGGFCLAFQLEFVSVILVVIWCRLTCFPSRPWSWLSCLFLFHCAWKRRILGSTWHIVFLFFLFHLIHRLGFPLDYLFGSPILGALLLIPGLLHHQSPMPKRCPHRHHVRVHGLLFFMLCIMFGSSFRPESLVRSESAPFYPLSPHSWFFVVSVPLFPCCCLGVSLFWYVQGKISPFFPKWRCLCCALYRSHQGWPRGIPDQFNLGLWGSFLFVGSWSFFCLIYVNRGFRVDLHVVVFFLLLLSGTFSVAAFVLLVKSGNRFTGLATQHAGRTDGRTDRPTDRQTDRPTDRHPDRWTEWNQYTHTNFVV